MRQTAWARTCKTASLLRESVDASRGCLGKGLPRPPPTCTTDIFVEEEASCCKSRTAEKVLTLG